MPGPRPAWRPWHGWLPAVLPASVRTFRSADPELAETLRASGAVESSQPDVELAVAVGDLVGDAPCAVVFRHENPAEGAGLLGRVTGRLGGVARTASGVTAARRRLRALGYPRVDVIPFDQERRPGLGPLAVSDARALPLSAIVVGRRDEGPTVLEDVAGEGVARLGLSGVVLVLGEERVVRMVLRAGAGQIDDGVQFLRALRAAGPPAAVGERVAWPEDEGESALVRWVAEPRLPGAPVAEPGDAFFGDCVEFLADLFGVGLAGEAPSLVDAAALVASACPEELTGGVRALGERVEAQLADVPRGVAHGDFWRDNLLADGGRLRGVVDWSGAGGGRLPLLDLFHLLVDHAPGQVGDAIVGWLLPEAERGGGPLVTDYCRRVGLDPDPALLRSFAAAYWLDHMAHHLRSYADRAERPAWLARNVHAPAAAFSAGR